MSESLVSSLIILPPYECNLIQSSQFALLTQYLSLSEKFALRLFRKSMKRLDLNYVNRRSKEYDIRLSYNVSCDSDVFYGHGRQRVVLN